MLWVTYDDVDLATMCFYHMSRVYFNLLVLGLTRASAVIVLLGAVGCFVKQLIHRWAHDCGRQALLSQSSAACSAHVSRMFHEELSFTHLGCNMLDVFCRLHFHGSL